jgi:hypothetical protein
MNLWDTTNIWHDIIITLIVTLILAIIAFFWKNGKLLCKIFLFRFYNEPVRINLMDFHKYDSAPEKWLSNEIYEEIQRCIETHKLIKKSINERCIKLYSDILGHNILIWLNEEFDSSTIGSDMPEILGYTVKIEIENGIDIGIRKFHLLNSFVTIATIAQETIKSKCFPLEAAMKQRFTICSIRRDFKMLWESPKKIIDKELNAEISILEDRIIIYLSDLPNIVKTIDKYFYR